MDATVTTTTAATLFPLPLTPFEYYYWCDDRPEYPTMYPVEFSFSGVLQREPLARAFHAALARHPMLDSRIGEGPDGRPCWIGSNGRMPEIDWAPEGAPITHPQGEFLDLRTSPGLRIWVRHASDTSRLIFQVHHACCDGIGALRFIEDVMVLYHQEIVGQERAVAPRPVNVELLRHRGDFPPVEGWRAVLRDWYVGARLWGEIVLHKPAPLSLPVATPGQAATPPPFLSFETQALDAALVRRLRAKAGSLEMTMNDLLLRDMFLTIQEWNQRHGQRGNPWLRINMPASMRERDDQAMPAANLLGFSFLTHRDRECTDAARLLARIHEETEAIKNWRLGWYFLGGLAAASGIPGMVPWFLRRNRSFATVVLSNLGRVLNRAPLPREGRKLVCGDVVLQRVLGVPPVRHLTRASMAVVTYADETTFNLRCDPRLFTVEQTRQLLAGYVARLEATGRREK
jgi:hypothetical protein